MDKPTVRYNIPIWLSNWKFKDNSCNCLAKTECIYEGYSSCRREYLQEEIPDWYYDHPFYKDEVGENRWK